MTISAERPVERRTSAAPLDATWRESQERRQEAALPGGETVVSCGAPLGGGGLGRHLQEIVTALERVGRPPRAILCTEDGRTDGRTRSGPAPTRLPATRGNPLLARSPGWSMRWAAVDFDRRAARTLPTGEHLLAFNGQGLAQLRRAGRAGYRSLSLVSATAHMRQVTEQHARARARYPLERSWADRLLARNLAEYAAVERIYVASEHVRESFLARGLPEERLVTFPLTPDRRFVPSEARAAGGALTADHARAAGDALAADHARAAGSARAADHARAAGNAQAASDALAVGDEDSGTSNASPGTFDVVYVGSLSVAKGVPLLIDAVRSLAHPDLRLVLVGGWGTRGMRRFVGEACAADARIDVVQGDPLAHLQRASLCVHPSYEDGFGYAPAEALACGVPVLVSDHTGMKELVREGRDGAVVPSDDPRSLSEAIEAAYDGDLLSS